MWKAGPVTISVVAFAWLFGCTPALAAKKETAPPPQQILTAKKVFISNGGGEDGAKIPLTGYQGAPDRAYNDFYAGMKSWGRYQLAQTPAEADLVFEIQYLDIYTWDELEKPHFSHTDHAKGAASPPRDQYNEHPQISLSIVDLKTGNELWTVKEEIHGAIFQASRGKNFDHAVCAVVNDVRALLGERKLPSPVPANVPAAPAPPQIVAAAKVFVGNSGIAAAVSGTGGPEQPYNEFCAALTSWGRYRLLSSPAGADLVFEFSSDGTQLRLSIIDPATRVKLWGFIADAHWALSTTAQAKNFHQAIIDLVANIARVIGQPAPPIAASATALAVSLPVQLSTAQAVFLSKPDPGAVSPVGATNEELYSRVDAAVRGWGRLKVSTAADCTDLIMEPSVAGDQVALAVMDPATRIIIWRFIRHVPSAIRASTAQKNFNAAVDGLMDEMRKVVAGAAAP
jgi:hypothetical protein